VGVKLIAEYFHTIGVLHFEIPKWLSIGLIIAIFLVAFIYARKHGPRDITGQAHEEEATELLKKEGLGSADN
jgi:hypothetical protein